jgi:UDP-2,3-diacylglucosamine hydrolase
MKLTAISDVHVKQPHDKADALLMSFLTHPEVRSSNYVALLGDIFDLMCGPHPEYLKKFQHIFDQIDNLLQKGVKVRYYEGNHDLHLSGLFMQRWRNESFLPITSPEVIMIDGKKYYLSHGDEHEIDNESYQKYKKLITSPVLTFVANQLMPYDVLNFLGERASGLSRKKGHKSFNAELVMNRFRSGVSTTVGGQYDFILGGHSHVQDIAELTPGSYYINNGYALQSKTFIKIDNHQISFPSLVK